MNEKEQETWKDKSAYISETYTIQNLQSEASSGKCSYTQEA